jgi:hypothetical protein
MNQWLREPQLLGQDLAPQEEQVDDLLSAGAEINFFACLKPQCGHVISLSEKFFKKTNSSKTLPQF